MIEVIGFDADDTLWHNMPLFSATQEKFKRMLSDYHPPEWIEQRLNETESRNIRHFGYGIKGFTLSMIETAIELSEGRITGTEISRLIGFAKEMLAAPIQLLDRVEETIRRLSTTHRLMLITKGDLFDQETKLARSGIGRYFSSVEIVSRKTEETYARILEQHQLDADRFLMVGDSIRSDILPVVAIGGHAVHIPPVEVWVHEVVADEHVDRSRFHEIAHIGELPELVTTLSNGSEPAERS